MSLNRRDLLVYHARELIRRIQEYTRAGRTVLFGDQKTQDAVLRNLEIIGQIVRDLDIDWRRLFAAVEGAVAPGIRMMSIRPDPLRQLLQIEAKAADGTQAQRFIDRLQRDGTISDAYLVREERNNADGLLSFTVRARWEIKR